MAINNPYQQYQQQSVMTASPGELVVMLYNGCIRFIKQAIDSINDKDLEGAHKAIIRAQDIILEFMSTLDMKYEVSHNLLALYDYLYRRLVEANTRKDVAILEEVLMFVTELRDTWAEALKITRKQVYKKE
ncbi:flagellar export chaperone FliS [Caldicoprobacter guelmensis]|uniref:flagellar export chaperone FliS n=1 Tax=Caldicoprobacter guelmensis TaxID=1170224 RepID=UPI001956125A|nr:flagellar export chaperone FliS [Caldicoprobacter guelmensis]